MSYKRKQKSRYAIDFLAAVHYPLLAMIQNQSSTATVWGPFQAVVFDLDGTLVELAIDFNEIRKEIGCPQRDILGYIDTFTGEARQRVLAVIEAHEAMAVTKAQLIPHAAEVLEGLANRGVKTAILTRNSAHSAVQVLEKFSLRVNRIIGRDDAPPKPSPEPLRMLARSFALPMNAIAMVGDFLYDLQAARNTGVAAILLLSPRTEQFIPHCDFAINKLTELYPLVIENAHSRSLI